MTKVQERPSGMTRLRHPLTSEFQRTVPYPAVHCILHLRYHIILTYVRYHTYHMIHTVQYHTVLHTTYYILHT